MLHYEDDVLVCSECGSENVCTLALVGINDQLVDFDSFDTGKPENNVCLDCGLRPRVVTRKVFLTKMNAWWKSLPEPSRQLICASDPFARSWPTLLYYEKRDIYNAHKD